MKILSINVGQTQILHTPNNTTQTAINKQSVQGEVYVDHNGITGDEQADLKNHGGKFKAVYAYGYNHATYWQKYLNKPVNQGDFGENLSIDTLDEHRIMIGSYYRCGHVLLQARLFRQPCYKLGLKHNAPQLPQDFIQYGYSGVYFSVEDTGYLHTGMTLTLEQEALNSVSVYDLFDACFQPLTQPRKQVLEIAQNSPFLPEEWRVKCARKLAKAT